MSLLEQAQAAAKKLRGFGADDAKVVIGRSRGVEIEWRDGQLDRIQERTQRSLRAAVYVDGKYSSSSTNDLRDSALESFLNDAVEMTRLLEPDPHRGLPEAARYEGRADIDLDLEDKTYGDVSSSERKALAQELETLIRERAGDLPIISLSTSVGDNYGQSARVHTNGFIGESIGTSFSIVARITVKDEDGRRPMGFSYTARRHRSDLRDITTVADEAIDKARNQLGAGKLSTGKYTIVVDRKSVPRLLGAFLSPLGGAALQQKRSLWDGRLGDQIASPLLTIYDEPHIVRGSGSGLWDSDGFATHRRPLLLEGKLQTYLIDQYYARKLGVDPTGGDTHNFEWTLGDKDLSALVADVGEGMYIDRFLGGNSNQTTGEVSYGCAGRVIRNGQLAEPVAEVNLAGHFGEIWERLEAVGSDPNPESAAGCPTCVFGSVQLSGA